MPVVERQIVGGSFAPPLPMQDIAKYRQIAKAASPEVEDAMLKLCEMMEVFRETPDSTLPGKPDPSGMATAIPLEDAEIERIWNHVPWEHECDMLGMLFDKVQQDEANRNGQKIEAWQRLVVDACIRKHFEDAREYEIAAGWSRDFEKWRPYLTPENIVTMTQDIANVKRVCDAVGIAFSTKKCDGVPYPLLEPTPIRNAAGHLLWYARELEKDREPITKDKLRR